MKTFKFIQTEEEVKMSIDLQNEEDMQDIKEMRSRESNNGDVSALYDLMDYIQKIGNGWDVIRADQLGNMSEAPMLIQNLDVNDDGKYEIQDDTKIYYYSNYQINHWMDILIRDGEVSFTALPAGNFISIEEYIQNEENLSTLEMKKAKSGLAESKGNYLTGGIIAGKKLEYWKGYRQGIANIKAHLIITGQYKPIERSKR